MTFNVEHVHLKTRDPAATARFYMETSDHSDFGSAAAGESSTVQHCPALHDKFGSGSILSW